MPSLVVIGSQIKEKQRGGHNVLPLAYMVPKDPSLNRVKCHKFVYLLIFKAFAIHFILHLLAFVA